MHCKVLDLSWYVSHELLQKFVAPEACNFLGRTIDGNVVLNQFQVLNTLSSHQILSNKKGTCHHIFSLNIRVRISCCIVKISGILNILIKISYFYYCHQIKSNEILLVFFFLMPLSYSLRTRKPLTTTFNLCLRWKFHIYLSCLFYRSYLWFGGGEATYNTYIHEAGASWKVVSWDSRSERTWKMEIVAPKLS